MFPVEIFEKILQHCDPVDLSRYKSVCSTWNAMIPRIIKTNPELWKKKCEDDIPKNMYRLTSNDWALVWRSWIGWHKLLQAKPTVETFQPLSKNYPQDQITCLTLHNDIIAVGSFEGFVRLFHINTFDCIGEIDVAESAVDLNLLLSCSERGKILVAAFLQYWTKFYEIDADKIVCGVKFHISSRFGGWRYESAHPENVLSSLLGWRYYSQSPTRTPAFDHMQGVVAGRVDGDELLLWKEESPHLVCSISEKKLIRQLHVGQPRVPIRRYEIFKPLVVACIGELGQFGFSVDGSPWKLHDLFQRFCAPVTAVLFHVCVLALGLESGEVHLFAIDDVASLSNLDFRRMKSVKLNLGSEAITTLKVTEHDSAQYIVATSARNLYRIKFVTS